MADGVGWERLEPECERGLNVLAPPLASPWWPMGFCFCRNDGHADKETGAGYTPAPDVWQTVAAAEIRRR